MDILQAASDGLGVAFLEDMDSILGMDRRASSSIRELVLESLESLKGLIFVSVENSSNLDPRFSEIVDHKVETDKDRLVGVNIGKIEQWLRLSSGGFSPTGKMIEDDIARRSRLCDGSTTAVGFN